MTKVLFRTDSYLQTSPARIIETRGHAVFLVQTVFYPTGGGQPGDQGTLHLEDGTSLTITTTCYDPEDKAILHILSEGSQIPGAGIQVTCQIDWDNRYKLMRMHSALHILCSKVDGPVTGGSIGTDKGRLDFDIEIAPDKDALAAAINQEIAADHPLSIGEISDEELNQNPDLIRTMSVSPPRGQGSVRTITIANVDYQPCGGTHVRSTREIGNIRIGKIEKKGKMNRRINIHFE